MSTSLLYHGFGVRGYRYVRTEYVAGGVVFVIEQARNVPLPGLWRQERHRQGRGGAAVSRTADRQQAGGVRVSRSPAQLPGLRRRPSSGGRVRRAARSYTRSFARYVLELSRNMTIKDVAEHLGISWDVIKEIQKRSAAAVRQAEAEAPAADRHRRDFHGKGHRYLTIVLDLERGAVVHVGQGKGGDALKAFWNRSASLRGQDRGRGHRHVAGLHRRRHDPSARGHAGVRSFPRDQALQRQALGIAAGIVPTTKDGMQKDVLKGVRWLLLKRPENLDPTRNEPERLQEALRLNEPLAIAYYLKEELNEILGTGRPGGSRRRSCLDWIAYAESTGIRMLQNFAKTLRLHAWGILAWYDYPISTGPLEGTNNKIKTMKRQAYGFRDQEFFRLKILGIHETKYALVG